MPIVSNDYKDRIRADIIQSLERYVKYGVPTGDFLRACLENNFMEAIGRADEENYATLAEIAMYIHWDIPARCHGSREKVNAWLDQDWEAERARLRNKENE